jgi:hypothetical protein
VKASDDLLYFCGKGRRKKGGFPLSPRPFYIRHGGDESSMVPWARVSCRQRCGVVAAFVRRVAHASYVPERAMGG